MNLRQIIGRYPSEQVPGLLKLIREFINCELQLYIGETHLRSWEEEAMRLQAQDIAMKLRAPPWSFDVDELDYLCDNAQEIIAEMNRF